MAGLLNLSEHLSALTQRIGQEIRLLVRPEHPGLARAWVSFGYEGTNLSTFAAHNVADVLRLGAGRYQITFATPLPDAHYCWVATARSKTSSTIRFASARSPLEDKTAQRLEIICTSNTGALADSPEINLVVYR